MTIQVNVASARGHDVEVFDDVSSAKTYIGEKARNENKWVFVDGELIADLSDLTNERLEAAQDITLSNQLVGG